MITHLNPTTITLTPNDSTQLNEITTKLNNLGLSYTVNFKWHNCTGSDFRVKVFRVLVTYFIEVNVDDVNVLKQLLNLFT